MYLKISETVGCGDPSTYNFVGYGSVKVIFIYIYIYLCLTSINFKSVQVHLIVHHSPHPTLQHHSNHTGLPVVFPFYPSIKCSHNLSTLTIFVISLYPNHKPNLTYKKKPAKLNNTTRLLRAAFHNVAG